MVDLQRYECLPLMIKVINWIILQLKVQASNEKDIKERQDQSSVLRNSVFILRKRALWKGLWINMVLTSQLVKNCMICIKPETSKNIYSFVVFFWASSSFERVLGRASFRARCWAAIRLSHRPEPSGRAVHEEIGGLDIGRQHGRRFVLLRHTHRPHKRP